MSEFLPPVIAVLGSNLVGFRAGMLEARREMGMTEQAAVGTGSRASGGLAAVGAAAIAVGVGSLHMATAFQSHMALIHTQALAFNEDTKKMGQALLDMAPQVGQSALKLADGLYHVESAGFRGSQALSITRAAAQTATLGLGDMESTTQALIAIMKAHIAGVKDAGDAQAWLNATVGTGDMRMGDLAHSLQNGIIPVFANAGLGAKDFAAAVATITDNATKPDVATTHLLHTIAMMESPTGKAVKALHAMGLKQFQLADDMRGPGGLQAAMHDLNSRLNRFGPDQRMDLISKIFGGGRFSGTVQTLSREIDSLDQKYAVGKTAVKDFGRAWHETTQTLRFQSDAMKDRVGSFLIELGQRLIPIASAALKGLNEAFDWLGKHKAVAEALGAALGGALAAGLSAAAIAAWEFMAPFLAVAVPIAAVSVALFELYKHVPAFRNFVNDLWSAAKQAFNGIGQVISAASAWWRAHHAEVEAAVRQIGAVVGSVFAWIGRNIHGALEFVAKLWQDHGRQVMEALSAIWGNIKTVVGLVVGIFEFAWPYLSRIVSTYWRLIKDTVGTAIKVIADIIGGFIDLLTGNWSHLWADLKTLVGDALGGIGKTLRDFASGAGDLLLQAGKDLVHGFVKGIKSVFGDVKNTLGDLTNSLTSWKGPASRDRVLLYENGRLVMQGFRSGLEVEYDGIHASLARFTQTIPHHRHRRTHVQVLLDEKAAHARAVANHARAREIYSLHEGELGFEQLLRQGKATEQRTHHLLPPAQLAHLQHLASALLARAKKDEAHFRGTKQHTEALNLLHKAIKDKAAALALGKLSPSELSAVQAATLRERKKEGECEGPDNHIYLNIDGHEVYKIVQTRALRREQFNVNNGLSRT